MNDNYDPIAKAQDATTFAQSRFGKHYMARLASVRDDHYAKARQLVKDGADPAHVAAAVARADEMEGEIGYFQQAQAITKDKTLMERIRENLRKKEKDDK